MSSIPFAIFFGPDECAEGLGLAKHNRRVSVISFLRFNVILSMRLSMLDMR